MVRDITVLQKQKGNTVSEKRDFRASNFFKILIRSTQSAFTCSKSTMETLEKCVTSVQS